MIDVPTSNISVALAMQYRLQQTEKIPKQQRKKLQNQAISKLLNHALTTVPYYRDHPQLQAMKGNIEWMNLPILTREILQKNTEQLLSTTPPENHGKHYEFRSSGSTGRPVKTFSSDYAQLFWRAITVREHLWANRNLAGRMATIKYFGDSKHKYPGIKQASWGSSTQILGYQAEMAILNSSESLERQYDWLTEVQPDYLLTYPSNLQELARIHLQKNRPIPLKNISTLGENVSPELRVLVNQAFGCKISDMYSSQEVGYMALQCPKHDHYHVQLENCIVEILDSNNKPCRPGEMGRVVVTTLQNYVMPLIRYEIGDYAIPGHGCDCGIQLPVIQRIIGRTRNLVTYPDGRKSWPSYNPMALMDIFKDARFQLVQTAINEITLQVQTEQIITKEIKEQATNIIQSAMGHPFNILIHATDNIQRAPSGKYEEFKSEILNQQAGA